MDVIVCGAGPAGSVAALNLAPCWRVLLLDTQKAAVPRPGETLPGAARNLLRDMGLLEAFLCAGHPPCHAFRSTWGAARPLEREAMAAPDGAGWLVDRVRFDEMLRRAATGRGAKVATGYRVRALRRHGVNWEATVDHEGRSFQVKSRLVVDATGRSSRLLSGPAKRRVGKNRMCCSWASSADVRARPGVAQVEAEADGWWYASPLVGGGAFLAFHTDADLPAARGVRGAARLLERAADLPMLGELARHPGWTAESEWGFVACDTSWLEPPAGDGWLAVGDAALAFDPISAQGLFNALHSGLSGAFAIDRFLNGDPLALEQYVAEWRDVLRANIRHQRDWYAAERRWCSNAFWRRRLASQDVNLPELNIGMRGHAKHEPDTQTSSAQPRTRSNAPFAGMTMAAEAIKPSKVSGAAVTAPPFPAGDGFGNPS